MFKKHKLEVRLVKDDKTPNADVPQEPTPDYVALTEGALDRLGKKLLVGTIIVIVVTAAVAVAASAADNALENVINN